MFFSKLSSNIRTVKINEQLITLIVFKLVEQMKNSPLLLEIAKLNLLMAKEGEEEVKKSMKIMMDYDISVNELKFLFLISQGELLVNEIAEILNLTSSTVSIRLNSLEEKNFIERISVEGDRRKKKILLTKKGNELVEERQFRSPARFLNIFENLTSEEQSVLNNILRKINIQLLKEQEGTDDFETSDYIKMFQRYLGF